MERRSRPSVERLKVVVARPPSPGDRALMVRELSESIAAGTYTVDPGLVAEAMLSRMRGEPASAVLVPLQSLDTDTVRVHQRDTAAGFDLA